MNCSQHDPPEECPKSHTTWYLVYICLMTIIIVSNLLCNTLCFAVLVKHCQLNYATKLFLLSLTSTDLCVVTLLHIPILIATILDSWPYGYVGCSTAATLVETFLTTNSLSILAVNVDRYLAVIKPLRYISILTDTRARIGVAVIWIVALSWGVLLTHSPGRLSAYAPDYHVCFSSASGMYDDELLIFIMDGKDTDLLRVFWVVMTIFSPVLLSTILFLKIFFISRNQSRRIVAAANNDQRLNNRGSRKAFTTCFLMTVCLLICTTPLALDSIYRHVSSHTYGKIGVSFSMIASLGAISYNTLNSFTYYIRNEEFRMQAKMLFKKIVQ